MQPTREVFDFVCNAIVKQKRMVKATYTLLEIGLLRHFCSETSLQIVENTFQ